MIPEFLLIVHLIRNSNGYSYRKQGEGLLGRQKLSMSLLPPLGSLDDMARTKPGLGRLGFGGWKLPSLCLGNQGPPASSPGNRIGVPSGKGAVNVTWPERLRRTTASLMGELGEAIQALPLHPPLPCTEVFLPAHRDPGRGSGVGVGSGVSCSRGIASPPGHHALSLCVILGARRSWAQWGLGWVAAGYTNARRASGGR